MVEAMRMTLIKAKGAEELENFVFQRMAESGFVGLSIATIEEGELNYKRGFGFRDFDRGTSVTPETTYCIGSVTKPFTALAVMQLHEKGLLSLDDPVEKYIPFKVRPMGEPILVKHLLSHSSGLANLGYAEVTLSAITDASAQWFPISSPQDLLVFMNGAEDWAVSKPGQRYGYLNEGYILLGMIIEEASGVAYADYVKESILDPLGMSRSTFREDEVEKDGDVATPYISAQDGRKVPTRYPYGQMIADGGLMSNAMDMIRFIKACLQGGTFEGTCVASSESIKDMMEPKIRTEEEPVEGAGCRYYGYGFRVKTGFFGHSLIHHSGSVYGSSAYMCFVPDARAGVVILASGGYFLGDIGEFALARLLGRDPMEVPYFRRGRLLDGLTGTYTTYRNISNYEVTRRGGILELTTSFGQRTFTTPLIPVDIEGGTKHFRVYGMDTTTPVRFVPRDGEVFMIYGRNLAKRLMGA
jgi:CubicO group peptidase (beta-lactamase class C family)